MEQFCAWIVVSCFISFIMGVMFGLGVKQPDIVFEREQKEAFRKKYNEYASVLDLRNDEIGDLKKKLKTVREALK